jgi:alpha-L-fucosidase
MKGRRSIIAESTRSRGPYLECAQARRNAMTTEMTSMHQERDSAACMGFKSASGPRPKPLIRMLAMCIGICSFAPAVPAADVGEAAKPTARQEEFLSWKFGMFIHFNTATYHERQWATGTEDPARFAPDALDCNQWMEGAASAGMKYAVLTVKHTCGWCLWDSAHTTHDITAFANYQDGRGDIVREFVDACRKHGMKVGLYYCFPGDFAKRHLPKGEEDKLRGLPPEANGDFTGFIKKQMTELLTRYGPVDLLWADQYNNRYTEKDWLEIKQHIKTLQPECLVIANNSVDFHETDIHSYEYPYLKAMKRKVVLPSEDNTHPAEVCDVLGPGWFWTSKENASNLKPADEVVAMLEMCNSRHANYLLNVSPDRSGLLTPATLGRLREIGRLRKAQP